MTNSLDKKIAQSKTMIEQVLRFYEKSEGGLYLANSGGKDSLACYILLKEMGVNIPIVHSNTTIDPIGTLSYIKDIMPETVILQPEETFFELVVRKMLPSRMNRYCCQVLKESYGIGKNTIEGVRASESSKRANRDVISCDTRPEMEGAQHIYIIYNWLDEDVYSFIRDRNYPLAPCYGKGMTRLGCVGCPQVTRKGVREFEFSLYPRRYETIKRAIHKGMELHPHWKISRYTEGNAELAMQWWLSGKTMREYFGRELPFIRICKRKQE